MGVLACLPLSALLPLGEPKSCQSPGALVCRNTAPLLPTGLFTNEPSVTLCIHTAVVGRHILQEQDAAALVAAGDDSAIQVIDVTGMMPRKPTGTPASKNTFTAGSGNYRAKAVRAHLSAQRVPVKTASARRAGAAAGAKAVGASSAGYMSFNETYIVSDFAYVVAKSKFKIYVYVDNMSGGDSPAGVVRVWADEPPGTVDCNNIPPKSTSAKVFSMPSGDYQEVFITVKAPATVGIHTMKLFLDTCSKNAAYTAEATLEYEVKAVAQPDLAITDVYTSPLSPAAGQEYKVAVEVLSYGYGPSTKPFRIRLYLDTPEGFVPKCSETDYVRSILSNPITKKIGVFKYHTYTFTATARDTPGATKLTAFVDSNCEVEEENEDENVYTAESSVLSAPRLPDLALVMLPSAAVKAGKTFKLKL